MKMENAVFALKMAMAKFEGSEQNRALYFKNKALSSLNAEKMAFLDDKYIREHYPEVFSK